MPTTIRLDPAEVLPEETPTQAHGDVNVFVSLSSYDVPRFLTVDQNTGTLRVTFDYVDKEESEERRVDDAVSILVGKNSGKVLAFLVRRPVPRDLTVRIVAGVDQQLAEATRDNQRLNYKLIKNVVSRKLESLLLQQQAFAT